MEATTYQEVQGLSRMIVGELREKYLDVFGEETRFYHKEFLRKRIAWRIQALAEGDLSERARRRAEELANDADLRTRSPRDPVASGSAEVKASGDQPHIPVARPEAAAARNAARPRLPRPRHCGQGPRQWKIERTFAWLGNFRRLVVRWDRLITVYRAFFHLACLVITLRQL